MKEKKIKRIKSGLSPESRLLLRTYHNDTKRYMGALSEEFQKRVGGVAEQFINVNNKLDEHSAKLDSHTEMIGGLMLDMSNVKEDVSILKTDVSVLKTDMKEVKGDVSEIKRELKKKVDYSKFAVLEKQIS
ncbi:MAG: hypothetical protein AAB952_00680 [Patescibacteria group bacterium]